MSAVTGIQTISLHLYSIVLVNPNEQERPKSVRTFTKWLTFGPKNGRTFGLCTIQVADARFLPFTLISQVSA
jgi:hypothetical protein